MSLSRKDNFNDPFDSKIHFTYDASRERDRDYHRQLLSPFISSGQLEPELDKLSQQENPIRRITAHVEAGMRHDMNEHGIICFTEISDSILMWSHYAGYHTGVCIGFRVNLDDQYLLDLHQIRYQDDAPLIPIDAKDKELGHHLLNALTIKAKDWEYEKE